MIVFHTLRYKNFLSTGNQFTSIQLDKSHHTLVIGENGAGKSTMLDALTFVLFSKPFRKITKPGLVNSINERECLVEIDFSIGPNKFTVRRGIKPARFEIWKNDKMINQDASAKDYQVTLEKTILKLNFKSFCQIVVLGTSSFVPFMQLTALNRREVIEDLLDIQIFSIMNGLLKNRIDTNKTEYNDIDYQIDLASDKIDSQNRFIDTIKQDTATQVRTITKDIDSTKIDIAQRKVKIEDINEEVQELLADITDNTTASARLRKYDDFETKMNTKKKKFLKEIKFFEDNDDCPTCTQHISENFRKTAVLIKECNITELDEGFDKLEIEIAKTQKRVAEIQNINSAVTELNSNVAGHNQHISMMNNYLTKMNKQLETLNEKKVDLSDEETILKNLKEKLEINNELKEKLVNDRDVNDMARILLKDDGVKATIIKQYIPVMNKLIAKHLAMFEFFVGFELDENFNEVIRSRHRDEFSYASFSEGEKQRIDLSLIFTWRAIAKMKNSTNTNLLIFDEVLDGSMDVDGSDILMRVLTEFGGDTNIFVISHNQAHFDKFANVIKFEKKKNFSCIAERT